MFSTIPMEEKHEKVKVLIEEHNMRNDEGYEESLKVLFSSEDSEHDSLKNKLIKITSPNANEVNIDEEDMMREENELLNFDQEVVHTDEEGNVNSAGSLKGAV